MYYKEIVYMNLFENDVKISCVGFFKLEKKQEDYKMELQVKNIPKVFTGKYPIRLQGENDWKEAGMISIEAGCGKWMGTISEPVMTVEILLADSHRIKGESKSMQERKIEVIIHDERPDRVQAVNDEPQVIEDKMQTIEERKQVIDEVEQTDDNMDASDIRSKKTAPIIKAEKVLESQNAIRTSKTENPPLYESKWEQLLATYEQIHPYGDNRVYVKLEPKDFIVLRSNCQHLVNNSFLLHGFYNYRYVILGKEKDFYIGVPGVFYEREKMVALMFGFEAFECEGGDAEEGKFGYYLRKVEI